MTNIDLVGGVLVIIYMMLSSLWFLWGLIGGMLILLELLLPGLVVVFFGVAALIVAVLSGAGFITSWVVAVGVWLLSSSGLVLIARSGGYRLGAGYKEHSSTNEELDAFGERVEVVESLGPSTEGRIRFRGSTWPARSLEEEIVAGRYARIITRDNLVWIVEEDGVDH